MAAITRRRDPTRAAALARRAAVLHPSRHHRSPTPHPLSPPPPTPDQGGSTWRRCRRRRRRASQVGAASRWRDADDVLVRFDDHELVAGGLRDLALVGRAVASKDRYASISAAWRPGRAPRIVALALWKLSSSPSSPRSLYTPSTVVPPVTEVGCPPPASVQTRAGRSRSRARGWRSRRGSAARTHARHLHAPSQRAASTASYVRMKSAPRAGSRWRNQRGAPLVDHVRGRGGLDHRELAADVVRAERERRRGAHLAPRTSR